MAGWSIVTLFALAVLVGIALGAVGAAERTGTTQTQSLFVITIESTNSPVLEGDTLTVTANVTNSGTPDTQTIILTVAGEQRDSESVTLENGETETVTLEWQTSAGDAGNYTATVESESGTASDSEDVAVLEPPFFDVAISGTSAPVRAGQPLRVHATVENTGDVAGKGTVVLSVNGQVKERTRLTVDAGQTKNITLSWQTRAGDAGNYTVIVASGEDDARVEDVTVGPPPPFPVDITGANTPVQAGETLSVTATVANPGDVSAIQDVSLSVAGETRNTTTVELGPGESTTVVLSWETTPGDAGNYSATVASATRADSTPVVVNAPPTVSISYLPDRPLPGQEVTFEAVTSDPGGRVDSFEWRIGGAVVSTSRIARHTFESSGNKEVTVVVTDDAGATVSATTTVPVVAGEGRPFATITLSKDRPTTNETVTFTADATDPDGSIESYEWAVDGATVGTGVELQHSFASSGRHKVELTVTDDDGISTNAVKSVNVNDRPQVGMFATPPNPDVGEEVLFVAEASDTDGSIEGYEWSVDGRTIATGQQLRHAFESGGIYEVTLTVTDDAGATASGSVEVSVGRTAATPTSAGPTPTDADDSSAPVPGFGLLAGVVALVAVAVLLGTHRPG